jgi:phosphoadenosine phosphosulfate reductase
VLTIVRERPEINLNTVNAKLTNADAIQIVAWAIDIFGDGLVMSTSFGIQAAVMLHLVTRVAPNIPVIWIDTGYLPPATYRFAEQLTEQLNLNLKVYQSSLSPARMEALHGKLWAQEGDVGALNRYDQIRKVEPMQQALRDLSVTAWLAGLRGEQTHHRQTLRPIELQASTYKILPILKWTSQDVDDYLQAHNLPYHPLWDKGYTTVGDWHSSRPTTADDAHERDTRFQGIKQECGLHLPLPQTLGQAESLNSSAL